MMKFWLGFWIFFVPIEARYEADRVIGYCPKGWIDYRQICYKYFTHHSKSLSLTKNYVFRQIHKAKGYFGALRYCSVRGNVVQNDVSLEWNEVNQENLQESLGNLVTLHSLSYLKRGKYLKKFTDKIQVNAIKINDKWWEIHHIPKNFVELPQIPQLHGTQELTLKDFDLLLDQANLYQQGSEGSILVFDTQTGKVEIDSDQDFKFVCVHKRIDRIGPKCAGWVAECNDRGFCYNGACGCTKGYLGHACDTYI